MTHELQIILYPDPRLKRVSTSITEFGPELREISERMFQLMREHKGVGLAAPQVGLNIRLFVMNATGEPKDDRVYINPLLSEPNGEEEGEEGCLSLPDIRTDVLRTVALKMNAFDLDGKPFEQIESGFPARVWQHECDHLNGTLIIDRMGPVARMTHRRALKSLEEQYELQHPSSAGEKATAPRRSRER